MKSYLVTCRSCGAANRVPADKEGVAGKCGSCHGTLQAMYWQPQQLTEASFDDFLARYDGPVLAEFWAPW